MLNVSITLGFPSGCPKILTSSLLFADPDIMKKLQVDRGAIRFVLAGANIMCPGLTSPGGYLDEEVGAETPVVHNMKYYFTFGPNNCSDIKQFQLCLS